MKSHLRKLTIIIPTYMRPTYAIRAINYWSDRDPNVIVIDGSPEPLRNTNFVGRHKRLTYLHSPEPLRKRLEIAAHLINTEYACLLGDDEFHLPSALQASIDELENDHNLVACMGRAVGFRTEESGQVVGIEQYPLLRDYCIDSSSAADRLHEHMSHYVPSTIYSVLRTPVFQKSFEPYFRKEFEAFASGEIQFEVCVSYLGKSKIIPVLHWLRSHDIVGARRRRDGSTKGQPAFHDWWNSTAPESEKKEFLQGIALTLSRGSGQSQGDIFSEVKSALDIYAKRCEEKLLAKRRTQAAAKLKITPGQGNKNNAIRAAIKRTFFQIATGKLSPFRHYAKKSLPAKKENQSLLDAVKDLSCNGVYVDFGEIEEIEEILRRS